MVEVRCPNCNSSFKIGYSGSPIAELKDGIHYLIPETIRNENQTDCRLKALENAGIKVDALRKLMSDNGQFKEIFAEDDPIVNELSKGGFIRNNELFRRWITAQTFKLLKDKYGWTHAVRSTYDIKYAYKQTREELMTLCKLENKRVSKNDKRFSFFTLPAMKDIICDFIDDALFIDWQRKETMKCNIYRATSYNALFGMFPYNLKFTKHCSIPSLWVNTFKGAGAFYTLQNVVRTHGLVLTGCSDMNESLATIDKMYNEIVKYTPSERRWDMLMSILVKSIKERNFELKY